MTRMNLPEFDWRNTDWATMRAEGEANQTPAWVAKHGEQAWEASLIVSGVLSVQALRTLSPELRLTFALAPKRKEPMAAPKDIFAPGEGYSYYYSDGAVYRKAPFQVPDVLTPDLKWERDARVDLAHDATSVEAANAPGLVERIYGQAPASLSEPTS
jgi:hypothetical protein